MNSIATVFVVDDDAAVRRSVSRLLRTAGYCAEVAASAAEFLRQATLAVHPCCAVLDMVRIAIERDRKEGGRAWSWIVLGRSCCG